MNTTEVDIEDNHPTESSEKLGFTQEIFHYGYGPKEGEMEVELRDLPPLNNINGGLVGNGAALSGAILAIYKLRQEAEISRRNFLGLGAITAGAFGAGLLGRASGAALNYLLESMTDNFAVGHRVEDRLITPGVADAVCHFPVHAFFRLWYVSYVAKKEEEERKNEPLKIEKYLSMDNYSLFYERNKNRHNLMGNLNVTPLPAGNEPLPLAVWQIADPHLFSAKLDRLGSALYARGAQAAIVAGWPHTSALGYQGETWITGSQPNPELMAKIGCLSPVWHEGMGEEAWHWMRDLYNPDCKGRGEEMGRFDFSRIPWMENFDRDNPNLATTLVWTPQGEILELSDKEFLQMNRREMRAFWRTIATITSKNQDKAEFSLQKKCFNGVFRWRDKNNQPRWGLYAGPLTIKIPLSEHFGVLSQVVSDWQGQLETIHLTDNDGAGGHLYVSGKTLSLQGSPGYNEPLGFDLSHGVTSVLAFAPKGKLVV